MTAPSHATVVFVGDAAVGKTSIIARWAKDVFVEEYECTLEDEVVHWIRNQDKVWKIHAIDTPGNEDFAAVRDGYFKRGDVIVFVYDVTRPASLRKILEDYWPQAKSCRDEDDVPCILVGNKTDCVDERRVTARQAEKVAHEMGTCFIELSAKQRDGQQQIQWALCKAMDEVQYSRTPREAPPLTTKKKKCGCIIA